MANTEKPRMHPFFLIVRARVLEIKGAVAHMNANDAHQRTLSQTNPALYQCTIHAESMVANIQGICSQIEDLLKALAHTLDGDYARHDLLRQVSTSSENRGPIIGSGTRDGLAKLSLFCEAARHNFAHELETKDVFESVDLTGAMARQFFEDLETFIGSQHTP